MTNKERGLTFDQLSPGDTFSSQARTVTETDVVNFAGLSGDFNPLHTDEAFGRATPFGGRIVHGMLVAAMATGMANLLITRYSHLPWRAVPGSRAGQEG